MSDLWSANHPRNFWLCQPDFRDNDWQKVIMEALPVLDLLPKDLDMDSILELTLGETRFGLDHWSLSPLKRLYYILKPILPRALTRVLRRLYSHMEQAQPALRWPVESRYAEFLWESMRQLLRTVPDQQLYIKSLWPGDSRYAFVLTHDVESALGQSYVRAVADLEECLGVHSSFNFVPEGYRIDMELIDELRNRGFEIGIHGLKHDGKLFQSRLEFDHRVVRINQHLKELRAVGFRAPLTIRNPEWMQSLQVEYELSFFDTDPFEPIPGGTMSIWPFFLGHFVELPYTLVQDYTLTSVLGESSPRLWLEKVDFIEKYHGMVLLNSHPDYLRKPANLRIYSTFLSAMKDRAGYWQALPREVARWWRQRAGGPCFDPLENGEMSFVSIVDGNVCIDPYTEPKTPENKMLTS